MKKQDIDYILRLLIESKLWITLGICSLYFFIASVHGSSIHLFEINLLIAGTLFIYLLHQYSSRRVSNHLGIYLLVCSLFGILIQKQEFFVKPILPMVFLGIIAMNYLGIPSEKYSIRNVPILKPLILGFVWSSAAHLNLELSLSLEIGLTFILLFSMISAQAIVFDIKDIHYDQQNNRQTLATQKGIPFCKHWATVILVANCMIALIGSIVDIIDWQYTWILLLTFAVQIGLIQNIHPNRNYCYYYFILDGTLLIPGLLALLI